METRKISGYLILILGAVAVESLFVWVFQEPTAKNIIVTFSVTIGIFLVIKNEAIRWIKN